MAVITRLGWIRRQQKALTEQQRQSQREKIAGESHYVQGRRYRLDVIEHNAPPSVVRRNNRTLELRIRSGTQREKREEVLREWYRDLLRGELPKLLAKWEPLVGVKVAFCGIKKMKTRWGSCNSAKRRVWLNLELAKKSTMCLEYILVHEMVHILERHHNDRFRAHMDKLMPQWQQHRDALNRAPLAFEDWKY